PAAPARDEVQVRVLQVGICGTDLHAFEGKQPFFTYPRILGHELAVEVIELGPTDEEHDLKIGDRCCVQPYLNCGQCDACRRGRDNCCMRMQVFGVHCDGGMREMVNVPLKKLIKASHTNDELALVEMLSIGFHAVRRAEIVSSDTVLVIGVGPIGLGVALSALETGARVIAADISQWRLDFANRSLGIEHCINARENIQEQLYPITADDLPTVVFDVTGNSKSMHNSFQFVGHGGRLSFVSLFPGNITFNDPDFHRRELTLLASRNANRQDFERVLQSLSRSRVDVSTWITHRVSPQGLIEEFTSWLNPSSNVMKAMMTFP
ncbi:MAG: zinc-binding alcohol dehydrogenase family protein, partial [Anaerolineae bacterium]|nr:zinc-binding alcohol dehydrogenase family protein [Anaerolineae bacterium]